MEIRLSGHGSYHHELHIVWIPKYRKKIYCRNEFWSPGFFSSTAGIDEEVIKRYVEFQEKVDKGQLTFKFKV